MAGDWIKMRVELDTDPDVVRTSVRTGLDEYAVVGRLHKLWSWADRHSTNGLLRVSSGYIDRLVACPGFADALVDVGWLRVRHDFLELPEWSRHNGLIAKARAGEAARKRVQRNPETGSEKCPDKVPDKCPQNIRTREEVEKRRIPTSSSDEESVGSGPASLPDDEAWMAELQRQFADRDVAGERVSFLSFCQRKGTSANRSGFLGWLKKASPRLQKAEPKESKWTW
jgi:hypothetical protein